MALIDFKCEKCGYKFFELVNFKDRDRVKCPQCESSDVKQIYEGQCYFDSPKKDGNTACENYGRCRACEGMCH
jgi:putative FmdB family regulatory protein